MRLSRQLANDGVSLFAWICARSMLPWHLAYLLAIGPVSATSPSPPTLPASSTQLDLTALSFCIQAARIYIYCASALVSKTSIFSCICIFVSLYLFVELKACFQS